MHPSAPFALLLDVDGPIASPVTRTVAIDSIIPDLVAMANAGVPTVFNTGRADAFLREEVLTPMLRAGLRPDAPVHAVAEKGAVWFSMLDGALTPSVVDEVMQMPNSYRHTVRDAVAAEFADSMFYDETKLAMTSIEMNVGFPQEDYPPHQDRLERFTQALLDEHDLNADFHIVPSIISIDVEHRRGGKALGAERAVALLRRHEVPIPQRWITVGDSRIDYDMATWLHQAGYHVEHVDVRPAEGVPATEFPVITEPGLVNDAAAAVVFSRLRAEVEAVAAH